MRRVLNSYPGVFTPDEVRQMQAEMDRTEIPGETEEQRVERALAILRDATLKRTQGPK